jgi:hypothetical protein
VGYGRFQFGLPAPRDEDVSAFDNEGFRRGEADAGVAAGDDGDLSLKLSYKFNSFRRLDRVVGLVDQIMCTRSTSVLLDTMVPQ